MTFFNPKEEVLDIELTPEGKKALSVGRFKPSYYLFFDDNVLYDAASADDTAEHQNNIEPRIQEETPTMKTLYSFSEASEKKSTISEPNTHDKYFSLASVLGTSELSSEKFPRWDIRMFGADGPTINKSAEFMTSSFGTTRIPQVDVDVKFKTAISYESLDYSPIKEDPNLSSTTQADGSYICVEPRTILMQVLEKYSVFEKEKESLQNVDTSSEIDSYTQLFFKKDMPRVVEGILIDEPAEICHDLDSTYVEYYFDIFVDKEISEGIREVVTNKPKTQSRYISDMEDSVSTSGFEILDIYSQVVPDDACPVDECT